MSLNSPKLWVVATPIGNPGDLSPRAKAVLESVDIVLAEDTRRSGILCQHCKIPVKQFMSFHDHNEDSKIIQLITMLLNGKTVALISDAGMPIISDPGYRLVQACQKASIPISVIPGPCAPITALAGCGIAPQPFTFLGFLPRSRADQEKLLEPFITIAHTLVFFERKDRLIKTLAVAYAILGSRDVCIARELTKTHEEYIHFKLEETLTDHTLLGELTVIIGPPLVDTITDPSTILALIDKEKAVGGSPREIARRVQTSTKGWTIKKIYNMVVSRR